MPKRLKTKKAEKKVPQALPPEPPAINAWCVQAYRGVDNMLWTHTICKDRNRVPDRVVGGRGAFNRLRRNGCVRLVPVRIVPLPSSKPKAGRKGK